MKKVGGKMGTTVLTNIGKIISGNINQPILDGDTIIVENGKIKDVGYSVILKDIKVDKSIDLNSATVIPGLIDSHLHPVIGDFTTRQMTVNFLDSIVHRWVTTVISAGEPHFPGRPRDPEGVKALALLAHKSFKNLRPNGLKVHAGALILEDPLTPADIEE